MQKSLCLYSIQETNPDLAMQIWLVADYRLQSQTTSWKHIWRCMQQRLLMWFKIHAWSNWWCVVKGIFQERLQWSPEELKAAAWLWTAMQVGMGLMMQLQNTQHPNSNHWREQGKHICGRSDTVARSFQTPRLPVSQLLALLMHKELGPWGHSTTAEAKLKKLNQTPLTTQITVGSVGGSDGWFWRSNALWEEKREGIISILASCLQEEHMPR